MNVRAAIVVASVLLSAALPARAVPYGMLLESDQDRNGSNEVYALTYDQWTDVLANNIATQNFTPLDINPLFGLTGFSFDGAVYRMLLESNADRSAGNEIYALTYNTWADVLTNTIAEQYFLPLDLNPVFSAADLSWDGTAYRMLLESDGDRGANNEVYALTYNTWADVLANNVSSQMFTPLDINPVFSAKGFGALAFPTSEPPNSVPEPSTLALFVLGLGWLTATRIRKTSARSPPL